VSKVTATVPSSRSVNCSGVHPADPGQWLGEEQDEQSGDAGVELHLVLLEQPFDMTPPFVVCQGHSGQRPQRGRDG